MDPLLETLINKCTNCLTKSFNDDSPNIAIKEFNSQKGYLATLILSYLCRIYKFNAASYLVPFIGDVSSSDNVSDCESRGVAFTALSCALHCGELDKYLDGSLRNLFPLALQTIVDLQMSRLLPNYTIIYVGHCYRITMMIYIGGTVSCSIRSRCNSV